MKYYTHVFIFYEGHQQYMYDILEFHRLQDGGLCKHTVPATCTVLLISSLKWSLHGHHSYYFTIKATNLAGLSIRQTSVEYRHDVQLPSRGIVTDMPVSQSSSQQPKVAYKYHIICLFLKYILANDNLIQYVTDLSFTISQSSRQQPKVYLYPIKHIWSYLIF